MTRILVLSLATSALLASCSDAPDTSTITVTDVGVVDTAEATSGRPPIAVVDTAPMRVEFDGSRSLRANAVAGAFPATYSRILASSFPTGIVDEDFEGMTLLVPTEAALLAMDPEDVAFLLDPDQRDAATAFYMDSAVGGSLRSEALAKAVRATPDGVFTTTTPRGTDIAFRLEDGQLLVTNASGETARVVQADVTATDGVVHYIDTVLWSRP